MTPIPSPARLPRSQRWLLLVVLLLGVVPGLGAATLTVATAANFRTTLEALAPDFAAQTGYTLRVVSGSTGKLYAQIVNGAPFDVLLAADTERPARLEAEGFAEDFRVYALGQLALWQPDSRGVSEAILRDPGLRYLALASPDLAPYGQAGRGLLAQLGLGSQLAGRLVYADNVSGAHALVATGSADAGLVALSQLLAARVDPRDYWVVPEHLYPEIRQAAVVVTRSSKRAEGRVLLDFLASEPVRRRLVAAGYRVP